jgi:putative oxidoreductase
MLGLIDLILSMSRKVGAVLHCVIPLFTRMLIGQEFIEAGYGHWHRGMDAVAQYFQSLGIPAPYLNAVFISSLELVGGIALVIGLGTRVFAFLLACTMAVAILTAKHSDFLAAFALWPEHLLIDLSEVVYLFFLLWLVTYGPGVVSIDRLIDRSWSRRRSQQSMEKALEQSRR